MVMRLNIGISGKAKSGKNTLGAYLEESLAAEGIIPENFAFADPIKRMILEAYPTIPKKWLYGPSEERKNLLPNTIGPNGKPMTVRDLLIEIGNVFGRQRSPEIWVNALEHRLHEYNSSLEKSTSRSSVIVTDVRFKNEFECLKRNGFLMIRIVKDDHEVISDISETQQDEIPNDQFDYVINNNASKYDLRKIAFEIVEKYLHKTSDAM